MTEITEDAKLKIQMSPNPETGEMEALITIKGSEEEHGWFFMRKDLVNFLAHGQVVIPHAEKASKIEVVQQLPGSKPS